MRHVDSFEIQPPTPPSHNGVPRSAWARARRRVSTWHRPYTVALLLLDFGAVALAELIATRMLRPGGTGLPARRQTRPGSTPSPSCCCRSAGWSSSGATAPTTAGTWGSARTSSSGSSGAAWTVAGGLASSPSPPRPTSPVCTVGVALLGALVYVLLGCGICARCVLHLVRRRPATPRTGWCWSAPCRRPRGLHGDHPRPERRAGAGRHPHHRRIRRRPGHRDPGAGLRRPGHARPWSARSTGTPSRSAARPAPSRASCAGWPGSWRAPASTWSSPRSSPTSPAPACTSARSRACRCSTSRSRTSPGSALAGQEPDGPGRSPLSAC